MFALQNKKEEYPMNWPPHKDKVLFQLSLYSNLVSRQKGKNLEGKLYRAIQDKLGEFQKEIGRWEIVWGPAVEQAVQGGYAINAMYAARSLDASSRYVVAIAGTNSSSLIDWLFEDFWVLHQVPWVFGQTPGARIALCTAIGLAVLLFCKPGGDRPGAGMTLIEFLKELPAGSKELSITGHSLGGALSPTLALMLKDIRPYWDAGGKTSISAMPTAGPTAGNSAYSRYSDRILKEVDRYWNRLDVVPHAWNKTALGQIKTIYEPAIPESPAVDFLVNLAGQASLKGDYAQIKPWQPPLPGAINEEITDPQSSSFVNFFRQVGYQHLEAYERFFAIPGIPVSGFAGLYREPVNLLGPTLQRFAEQAGLAAAPGLTAGNAPPAPTIPLAGQLIELPAAFNDPRIPDIIGLVTDELNNINLKLKGL